MGDRRLTAAETVTAYLASRSADGELLMMRPQHRATGPINDELTRNIMRAWRSAEHCVDPRFFWRGSVQCLCGARSDIRDHWIRAADGRRLLTNALCVHYVACHRGEVSPADREIIIALPRPAVLGWRDLFQTREELDGYGSA